MSTELAWAAGFYDGEGSTSVATVKQSSGKTYRYIKMSVSQNEREPLERFMAAVGEGKIVGPYKGRPRIHHWNVVGAGASRTYSRIEPFLSGPKRRQFARVAGEVSG